VLHETTHLPGAEGRQGKQLEAGELPLRVGVGVRPGREQQPRCLGKARGKVSDGFEQAAPLALRLGDLVQPVQQEQAGLLQEALLKVREQPIGSRFAQVSGDVGAQRLP
jgi:hypothetical protein